MYIVILFLYLLILFSEKSEEIDCGKKFIFTHNFCTHDLFQESVYTQVGTGTESPSSQILSEWDVPKNNDPTACTVDHVLQLLQRLYAIAMEQRNIIRMNGMQSIIKIYEVPGI